MLQSVKDGPGELKGWYYLEVELRGSLKQSSGGKPVCVMKLPETVYRTPEEWGTQVFFASKEAARQAINELHNDCGWDVSIDDLLPYTLRPDGRYEGESDWGDGFRAECVHLVELAEEGDDLRTLRVVSSLSEKRSHSKGGIKPLPTVGLSS